MKIDLTKEVEEFILAFNTQEKMALNDFRYTFSKEKFLKKNLTKFAGKVINKLN